MKSSGDDVKRERLDVLDDRGVNTGRTVVRGATLKPGEYHLVVQVWLRSDTGSYLIQRRAPDLDSDPDVWATTAGYALAGEDSLAAAIRETDEELGLLLSAHDFRLLRRLTTGSRIEDVWLVQIPAGASTTLAIGPEVTTARWASKSEIEDLIHRHEFFPYSYFADLPA